MDKIIKKHETYRIKYKYCECCLEYINIENNLIEQKCLCYNKNYQNFFDENLKKGLLIHINLLSMISMLLLQKAVYPYEYMDDWEKFNEKSLPEKEDFYSHLNMDDIAGANYAKRVHKNLKIENLSEYRDLYVQINTLLLADVFENFQNIFVEIY